MSLGSSGEASGEAITTKTIRLQGERATRELGARIAALLQPGDFIGLVGELGAGKTALARSICTALDIPREHVTSPSFAVVCEHTGGRVPVCHADFYRIRNEDDLYGTGFFDFLGGAYIVIVEWVDKVRGAAPSEWLRIELTHAGARTRIASLTGYGARGAALVNALTSSSHPSAED